MKIFLKSLGYVLLILVTAGATLAISGYVVANKADDLISQQVLVQIDAARDLADKTEAIVTPEQHQKLLLAIANAQKAADNTNLNLKTLINCLQQLSNQIAATIQAIEIPDGDFQ